VGLVLRGKWRLDGLLGVGGMAAVYAGTHRNGKRGAVKMLHQELSAEEDVRKRFLREGYVANAVGHPGAVSVLDDDLAEDGSVFLVMELLEGQTLEARASAAPGGRLPAAEVLAAADQLLDTLAAAHDKGIVHRDLKPDNVFLTRDGKVKILDFGLARLQDAQPGSRMTQTGTAMGTPAFMPPEQALGNWAEVGPRSDLWAVGALMFTLLTGRLVHTADTLNKLLLAAMTRPVDPLRNVMPGAPAELAAVVDRALAFDTGSRWPDAAAMRAAVRRAAGALGRADLTAPPPGALAQGMVSGAVRKEATSFEEGPTVETGTLPPTSNDPSRGTPGRSRIIGGAAFVVALGLVAGLGLVAREVLRSSHGPPSAPAAPSIAAEPTAAPVASQPVDRSAPAPVATASPASSAAPAGGSAAPWTAPSSPKPQPSARPRSSTPPPAGSAHDPLGRW
jgi:eukaryotic-like serine/threonine-protein kinase